MIQHFYRSKVNGILYNSLQEEKKYRDGFKKLVERFKEKHCIESNDFATDSGLYFIPTSNDRKRFSEKFHKRQRQGFTGVYSSTDLSKDWVKMFYEECGTIERFSASTYFMMQKGYVGGIKMNVSKDFKTAFVGTNSEIETGDDLEKLTFEQYREGVNSL